VSPVGSGEVALAGVSSAPSASRGSWASLGPCLAGSATAGHPAASARLAPASRSSALRACGDRGTELASAVSGMKWSNRQPLPCSCGCRTGWAPPCAQPAWPGLAAMLPATWRDSRLRAPRLRNLLRPGWHRLRQCRGDRQWFWGSRHCLWCCQEQKAGLRGWTRAAGADFPGFGREWLDLSFPDAELLAEPGTFQSALLSVGFPPGCWSERKQAWRR